MKDVKLYNSTNIADAIKTQAKSRGVALKDVLIACGLGSNSMSNLRHGRMIAADSLAKIADVLDCSVDYLLGRSNDPDGHKR